MVGTVIGENEERPLSARSWGGLFSVVRATVRRAAMQPSCWFGAALVAGALCVAFAAWNGGAMHDGRLEQGSY